MESLMFSKRLQDYLKQHNDINVNKQIEITKGTIEVLGNFLYDFFVPDSWYLTDIVRIDCSKILFNWSTKTEQAVCPLCNTVSEHRCKTYKIRRIQDLPMAGMTVYHVLKANRYYCDNHECSLKTFVEQFYEITDKYAMLSHRLKDFIVREAVESSGNGTAKSLRKIGIIVSKDTVIREVKKKGALVVEQNLKRDDIKVLSIDDINLRKGNSSTACSVFIDAETHRVLVIVQGASGEIAEKVIEKYPSVTMVSRERGTAYAAAAQKHGKLQVADGFHLLQNIHKAIKDALSLEFGHDLFVREGEGWIRMVDSASEKSIPDTCRQDNDTQGLVVIKPTTVTVNDIERRIHLAELNIRQANKYKKTMEILELAESGLRTSEIAKRLSMKTSDVVNYRKNAPETIQNVESKIDEYYSMQEQGQWEYHQKTIATNAKPSSESIVEPYKDTILRMFNEGKNHRNIHPIIVQEGFKGSANAVYQYLIKYAHENEISYGHNSRVIPSEERKANNTMIRPFKISIERISKQTIYEKLLRVAAETKLLFRGKKKVMVSNSLPTITFWLLFEVKLLIKGATNTIKYL